MADPASFLASTSVRGPYFSLRTACYLVIEKINTSEFVLLPHYYVNIEFCV